jgi:hypothetical protein
VNRDGRAEQAAGTDAGTYERWSVQRSLCVTSSVTTASVERHVVRDQHTTG